MDFVESLFFIYKVLLSVNDVRFKLRVICVGWCGKIK